jgi:hypothetical protein
MEPILNPCGRFVIYGDALNAVEAERERCFRIFMRYYDAQNFTPDEIRAALKP